MAARCRHVSLTLVTLAVSLGWVCPGDVGCTLLSLTSESWHADVSTGVVRAAVYNASVVGISKVEFLVSWVGTLPRCRSTYTVLRRFLLNRGEGGVHLSVTGPHLGVVLRRRHTRCVEQTVRTLWAVAVVVRSLAVVTSSHGSTSTDSVSNPLMSLDERSVADTCTVGEVPLVPRASSGTSGTLLTVVANMT